MIRIEPRCRVIVDNDWAGDPDGLLGLAHHALSPANRIAAVTSSLTNPMFGLPEGRSQRGACLAGELLRVLGAPNRRRCIPDRTALLPDSHGAPLRRARSLKPQ